MGKSVTVTVTVVANMTSNYGEGLGNITSVHKVYKNNKTYSIRSKESLKNAIMTQSGMYDDLQTIVDGATQKLVSDELNVSNCRSLESGYMNTTGIPCKRNSSFNITDAVSCEHFSEDTRFHNNLYMASNFAKLNNINLQSKAKESGLMIYQYEHDKSLKVYSMTIDLDMIGVDNNFEVEATQQEKFDRVRLLLEAVQNLSLVVKGNLDNAEPIFIIGGLSDRKTHSFENLVKVNNNELLVSDSLIDRLNRGFHVGLLQNGEFDNELDIISKLKPISIDNFFDEVEHEVKEFYKA